MEAELTIHRGSHQIGGCCTEIAVGGRRVLLDYGANLADDTASIKDKEMTEKVFGDRPVDGIFFSHYHGDHYGLPQIPENVPLYIGPIAKEILQVLAPYTGKQTPAMQIYQPGQWMHPCPNLRLMPLYVDHSALDAYMFYIEAAGRRILFTGDFREHGIVGEKRRLWRMLEKYVPRGIDLLVTEGTMVSRQDEVRGSRIVASEKELGQRAKELFGRHKYNFVLVSSTNLDSIMGFYHNTPKHQLFVCDLYQAKIILTAMKGMEQRGNFPAYQRADSHPVLRVLDCETEEWSLVRQLGVSLEKPVDIQAVTSEELYRKGFVLLARKRAQGVSANVFEKMRDAYYPIDGQMIYSMWEGYLHRPCADPALLSFLGGRDYAQLHSSGHAYVETIAQLARVMQPKTIVPMHTEYPRRFVDLMPPPYDRRVHVLQDGERLKF